MSRLRTSAVIKQLGLGILLVLFVVLVTLVFSFLGAIACSALVGMMTGSSRHWKWQSIPISLVFPAVIMGFLEVWKNYISLRESILVSIVCFGAFWITYLLAFGLCCLERQSIPPPVTASKAVESNPEPMADATSEERRIPVPSTASVKPQEHPDLEELQGTWVLDACAGDRLLRKQVIHIAHDRLALSKVDSNGQVQNIAEGFVRLDKSGPFKTMKVDGSNAAACGNTSEHADALRTWIYRVAGSSLILASNLEERTGGGNPSIERYTRMKERAGGS